MKAILTIYNSKRDTYGNVYYAVSLHDYGGPSVTGLIQPDNVSTRDCRECLDWYIERQELPIRAFNSLTKDWPYLGCTWPEIRAALHTRAGLVAPMAAP